MRLLNVVEMGIEEFAPYKIENLEYAILSHRWTDEEVVYDDIINNTAKAKSGYTKISLACQQAKKDGYKYIWIDSCCIDKSSSAELSEAINSMYAWYQKSSVCYAYLQDVQAMPMNTRLLYDSLAQSEWFERGWTLQELLAPSNISFWSAGWTYLGNKTELIAYLTRITGINTQIFTGEASLNSISIAQRMSWAAKRKTTRPEDIAYSLMGVFSVNMPMLYGEGGEKAFVRLQTEIMNNCDDHSLFAWSDPSQDRNSLHGLLAKSPAFFANSIGIIPQKQSGAFSMSNQGLRINLALSHVDEDIYVAALHCLMAPDYNNSIFPGLYLRKLPPYGQQYARINVGVLAKATMGGTWTEVFVRQNIVDSDPQGIYPKNIFQLCRGPNTKEGYKLMDLMAVDPDYAIRSELRSVDLGLPIEPLKTVRRDRAERDWIPQGVKYAFEIPMKSNGLCVALRFRRNDGEEVWVSLGSISGFHVGFDAIERSSIPDGTDREELNHLRTEFRPQPMGSYIFRGGHRVHVKTAVKGLLDIKIYLVNISIVSLYRLPKLDNVQQPTSKRNILSALSAKLRSRSRTRSRPNLN